MTDIKGNTIYMREADSKVLNAFIRGYFTGRIKRVSVRDQVFIRVDGSRYYKLWDTELVRRLTDGRVWIYITSEHGKDSEYYGHYGRRRDPAMTQTTRARLDAFLNYYGFNRLEVHSSKKLFGVWHNGKELEDDSWYELDFASLELVKVE